MILWFDGFDKFTTIGSGQGLWIQIFRHERCQPYLFFQCPLSVTVYQLTAYYGWFFSIRPILGSDFFFHSRNYTFFVTFWSCICTRELSKQFLLNLGRSKSCFFEGCFKLLQTFCISTLSWSTSFLRCCFIPWMLCRRSISEQLSIITLILHFAQVQNAPPILAQALKISSVKSQHETIDHIWNSWCSVLCGLFYNDHMEHCQSLTEPILIAFCLACCLMKSVKYSCVTYVHEDGIAFTDQPSQKSFHIMQESKHASSIFSFEHLLVGILLP